MTISRGYRHHYCPACERDVLSRELSQPLTTSPRPCLTRCRCVCAGSCTGRLGEGGADHGALGWMQRAQLRVHIHPWGEQRVNTVPNTLSHMLCRRDTYAPALLQVLNKSPLCAGSVLNASGSTAPSFILYVIPSWDMMPASHKRFLT